MKRTRDLLAMTTSMLKEGHPDLKETLNGLSPVYAKIIFSHRVALGYSQKELAQLAHVGQKTISRAEGGFDNLSTETYDKIFDALNLGVREIAEAMIQLGTDEQAVTIESF
ncbi:helix-turn-helix transcriptional regulator [Sporosarcina sp. ACRSM]|uniref:helix-turn-helix domain-containing protein n=1 Tax=Sporosarcina sp. ACRSM TaxID=2918216 RepID=UPI001EF6423F|nr:helix-turn-helix transcriptional regulator [Sporosarcina sp. ACRSM]MCG7334302.1 helix-turn-helix transcriptional regulator [Sporosarcina sp. ACRSM]